jgi:phosphopantetheinyl transferase
VVAYTMLCNALAYESEHLSGDDIVLKEVEEHQLAMPLIDPPLWRFGEQGKPFITNYENCHFNISHCTQAVTVAVASRNVGVDVEGPRRFNEGLLQRSMSPIEQAEIRQSSNAEATFSKLWTRKEAYFKWLGTGILITRLPFTEEDAAQAQCHIETQYVDVADFFLSLAFKISS